MNKKTNDKEKVLGPVIKILDENAMSSKVYHIKYPKKHEDIDLSPSAKFKIFPTNVLNRNPSSSKKTYGYYTNKRIYISYNQYVLLLTV